MEAILNNGRTIKGKLAEILLAKGRAKAAEEPKPEKKNKKEKKAKK